MARTLIVSDRHNSFFTANNIRVGNQIPVEGNYVKGDIIVNIGENTASEAMWICVESGNPGIWEVVGAGAGGNGGSNFISINDSVFVNEPVNEVSLACLGVGVSSKDKLIVHHNSIHLMEGVDYEISKDGTKIVKLTEGNWNEDSEENALFAFELFKGVESVEGDKIVVDSKLTSITNHVILESGVSEVEIGIEGFNAGNDMMLVFKNGVNMVEGVDYEVQGSKIVSTGEVWNENGIEDYGMTFVVFKEVVEYNGDAEVKAENIADGSIGMDKLADDVKGAIEEASNIDLSGYVEQEEYNGKIAELEGKVNEAFTSANNGKQLIASAIGNPLITGNSTFKAMSEAILGLRRESDNENDVREVLYNMMIEDGYNEATNSMTVDELIDLLDDSQIDTCEIKQIACGESHAFVLKNDGSLWACGLNDKGQLGLNNTTNKTTFTQVTTNINNDVKQVACGGKHTFIIKNDGSIWATGYNYFGQLGLNNTVDRNVFTQVYTDITDIKQIACGQNYTIILANDGSLWACGSNNYGEQGLGTSDYDAHSTFTKVTTNINNDVKEVVCGYHSTYILKIDGSLWACGYNNFGQLGLGNSGDNTHRRTFTQVTTNINDDVKQVVCGINFVYILKNDGTVWSCGCNNFGQLGLGTSGSSAVKTTFTQVTTSINNDVKQISCGGLDVSYGYDQVFILKNDGTVWSCGSNYYGQLGLGDTTDRSVFTQVTTSINNDVKQISCGGGQSFIFKNDGTVWSCGYNNFGQLGLGTSGSSSKKTTFTQVSTFSSVEIAEYEIRRLKLYYYLLDNEIEVTESMDIGTMLDLLVDDYVNNMILGYENNLRIILTDEGVSVSDEDNMDSLITKVDEEFDRKNANAGGGLDIISATELPATGKENQICVITDNPVDNFVITSNYSDINTNNTIYIFLGNSLDTTGIKGTNFDLVSNNITMKYYLLSVHQGDNKLDSYIYKNNQWTNATMSSFYIVEKGNSVNKSYTGGFTGDWVVGNLNGTPCYVANIPSNVNVGGGTMCFDNYTVNKINVSDYTTLEYTIASSMPDYYFAGEVYMLINTTRNTEEVYKYWKTSQPGSFTTYTIDISGITGEFYLGIAYIGSGYGQKLCVSDIRLY